MDNENNANEPYCDECGCLIDSATKGCQSAGRDKGCKGWDFFRDLCGFTPYALRT